MTGSRPSIPPIDIFSIGSVAIRSILESSSVDAARLFSYSSSTALRCFADSSREGRRGASFGFDKSSVPAPPVPHVWEKCRAANQGEVELGGKK